MVFTRAAFVAIAIAMAMAFPVDASPPLAVITDNIAVIDSSGAKDGRYVFVLDVQNGQVVVRQIITVVQINPTAQPNPDPPTPDPDPPIPDPPPGGDLAAEFAKQKAKVTDPDKVATAAGLAKALDGISDMIKNEELTTPKRAVQATNILVSGWLASKSKTVPWGGFVQFLLGKLEGQSIDGIKTTIDTAAAVLRQ